MLTTKFKLFSLATLSCIVTISCFGVSSVNAAALDAGPVAKLQLNIHLDQQPAQKNKTETEPDLSHKQQQPEPLANSSHTSNASRISVLSVIKDRISRQEVGQEVGDQVGSIITGVLGGGLGNVFEGSSAFIPNANVQEEVDFVLNNVAPPFETLLNYGFQGLKQYFGIGVTTPKTVLVTQPPSQELYLQPVIFENGTVQYIPIVHTVTKPPIRVTITEPPAAGASEDNERLEDIYGKVETYPLSRVDRLH